jgi:hypothetical protein
MKYAIVAAALAAAFSCTGASALEPIKLYDAFKTKTIDPTHWLDAERTRSIKAGQLELAERNWGATSTDVGYLNSSWPLRFPNASLITEMQARVTVTAVEVDACASNPGVGNSRARLNASFFNIGTPVANSDTGDVEVQLRVVRWATSTDPDGVLRVEGRADLCTNSTCTTWTAVAPTVDLGPVSVGQPVDLTLQWDQPNKQFVFSRDLGTPQAATATIPYTQPDTSPPGNLYKELTVRTDVANCASGPQTTGYIDALFDNVSINKSALPLK